MVSCICLLNWFGFNNPIITFIIIILYLGNRIKKYNSIDNNLHIYVELLENNRFYIMYGYGFTAFDKTNFKYILKITITIEYTARDVIQSMRLTTIAVSSDETVE